MAFLGGTFDPVHCGHLVIAKAVAEKGGFDRVYLVPAASPPHKCAATASAEHRLAMLRLALENEPKLSICDLELRREGPSYTVFTAKALREQFGPEVGLNWIIGADMLAILHKWFKIEELLDMVHILVAVRPPLDQQMDEIFARLEGHFSPGQIQRLREGVLQTPLVDISSTQIRAMVAQGKSIERWVPENVARYISFNKLYL